MMAQMALNSLPSETNTFTLDAHCSVSELKQLEGLTPGPEHYDTIISGDAVGVCGQTGRVVFILRQNWLSSDLLNLARDVFCDIDNNLIPSYSRCSAAGRASLERFTSFRDDVFAVHPDSTNPFQGYLELKNGKRFAKALSNPVRSYMAGYNYDRFRKLANPCGFTKLFPEDWKRAIPFFEGIESCLQHSLPDVAKYMFEWCEEHEILSRFTIGATCLSTVAINVNYESCFHYDRGDLDHGYSTLTVVSSGKGYDGGFLVLPKYRVAIDIKPGSVLLNQSHIDLHGNTPISLLNTYSKRISFVTYLKKTLRHAVNK